jgi:hypothetical protein
MAADDRETTTGRSIYRHNYNYTQPASEHSYLTQHRLGKVNLSLWLIKHHAMMTWWRYSFTIFLGNRCSWSVSRPGRFTLWESAPGTHWIEGLVGPKAGLDAVEEKKSSYPWREKNPVCPARSPSPYRLSQPGSLSSTVTIFCYTFYYCTVLYLPSIDRLCGLVVRVPGYRSVGPRFDSRRYQILWEVVGLERGPLNLVRITEELFQAIA